MYAARALEKPKTTHSLGRRALFRSKSFGLWDIDFYVKTSQPVLVSCKNPTKRASIIRKGQEAFLQLYGLTHLCPDVPADARIILVTGDLPLKTRGKDYEALIGGFLGERFSVVRRNELTALRRVLGLG